MPIPQRLLRNFILLQLSFHLFFLSVSCYFFTGYQIRDLEKNNVCFVKDTLAWSASALRPNKNIWSTCGPTYLVGGYEVLGLTSTPFQLGHYFSRTFTDLPPHSMLYFTYGWWAIDSWNGSPDTFKVQVDSKLFNGWILNYADYPGSQICGSSGAVNGDLANIRIFGKVIHSADTVTFKMISYLDQEPNNESFGLRDVNFLVVTTPTSAGSTESFCGLAPIVNLGAKQCSCPEGQYRDSTSTCVNCDTACSSCFGAGSNQCYECKPGYSFDGENCFSCDSSCTACNGSGFNQCYQCQSGNLLYHTTCVLPADCPFPMTQNNCGTTCDSPCGDVEYVYANQTCSLNCLFPLQEGFFLNVTKRCIYPCDASTQYLYWDGTCEMECEFPLSVRIQADERYCDFSCSTNTDYLYWNGTCSSECPSPLIKVKKHSRFFCTYPCDTDEYLYPDSSCKDECKLPYGPRIEAGKNYCDRLCPGNEYMLWKGGCIEGCSDPLRVITNSSGTLCFAPCEDPSYYYYPAHKTCKPTCQDTEEIIGGGLYQICYVDKLVLSKLLHHIRYVDVQFPHKLENISIMRGTNVLSPRVSSSMFFKVSKWPARFTLPSVFEYYALPSSFLANFADDLILLGMIITAAILSFFLEHMFLLMDCSGPNIMFNRIRILTTWNLPLMIMAHNIGDIIFFAVNEFKTTDFTSKGASLSFTMCIVMLSIVTAFYGLGFFLVNKAQEVKNEAVALNSFQNYANFVIGWEKFQVLFRGYDDQNLLSQSFFLSYSFRLLLPMIIASFLYKIPLLQAIIFFLTTLIMFLYLLCKRPIKKRLDLLNLIIIELFILVSDASLLCLVIFDINQIEKLKARTFFGDVIIVSNYCFSVFAILGMIIKIIMTIRNAYDFRSQNKSKQERSAWLQVFFIPLQQGGLGFEQVQIDSFSSQGKILPTPPKQKPPFSSHDETSLHIINYNKSISAAIAAEQKSFNFSDDQHISQDLDTTTNQKLYFGKPEPPKRPRRKITPFRPLPVEFDANQDWMHNSVSRRALDNFNDQDHHEKSSRRRLKKVPSQDLYRVTPGNH